MKEKIKNIISTPYIQRFIKNASWSLIGTISGKILFMLAFIIIARIIGKEEYGKIFFLRSTITMFLVFSSLGMGLTASRYVAYFRDVDKVKTYQIHKASTIIALIFGLILSCFIFIFSSNLSIISFGSIELSYYLKLTVIAIFFSTLSSAQTGTLTGFENFRSLGINNLIYGIAQFFLIVVGAYYWGTDGVIVSLGISTIIFVLLNQLSINRYFGHDFTNVSIFTPEIKEIFIKFSIPAMLSTFVALPVIWIGKTLLIRNNGFGEMAIFDVAEQWYLIMLFIPNSISAIILPMLTNTLTKEVDQYRKLVKLNLMVNCFVVVLLAIIIIVFAPFIMKLYGKAFTSFLPLRVLVLAGVLQTINNVLGQVIASKAKMWLGFIVNLIWGISFLFVTFVLVDYLELGALGLSYSFFITYLLHSVVQGIISYKIIN